MYSTKSTHLWTCLPKTFPRGKTVSDTRVSKSHGFLRVKGQFEFLWFSLCLVVERWGALWPEKHQQGGATWAARCAFCELCFHLFTGPVLCVESRVGLTVLAPHGPSHIWEQVWGPLQDLSSLRWAFWVPYRTWYRSLFGCYSVVCIPLKKEAFRRVSQAAQW